MTQPQAPTPMASPALIRTLIPMIVGYLVAFAARHGFNIDSATATPAITVAAGYLYWLAARYLETHHDSRFSWLLGSSSTPTYAPPPPAPEAPEAPAAKVSRLPRRPRKSAGKTD